MAQGGNGGGAAKGVNKVLGNWKDDILTGTAGVDAIFGRDGNDQLFGLEGDDTLDGGDGNDTLEGGAGDDVMTGGAGADLFRFFPGAVSSDGHDTITDFEAGIDQIFFDATEFDVLGSAIQVGSDVVINYGAGKSITLQNTLLGDLSASDFSFAATAPNIINGTDDPETLTGTSGVDWINGFGGDDVIQGLGDHDSLNGGEGNDTLEGGGGNDSLVGEGGDDTLIGGTGFNYLFGGLHNDILDNSAGSGVMWGEIGNDTLIGGASSDQISGGDDNDIMTGGGGADSYVFNIRESQVLGDDTITDFDPADDIITFIGDPFDPFASAVQVGADVVISYQEIFPGIDSTITLLNTQLGDLSANNFAFVDSLPNLIVGTEAADSLTGTEGVDRIEGLGGNDVIFGLGEADFISGGEGNDTLHGGIGADSLEGNAGADILNGGEGADAAVYSSSAAAVTIDLSLGVISGGDATGDTLISIEKIIGSGLGDLLIGDAGTNSFDGAGGNDTLQGGAGTDVLVDYLGTNTLDGGDGDDFLEVNGTNFDTLTGGTGADVFSMAGQIPAPAGSTATTTITDFEAGIDQILFSSSFDVLAAAQQVGLDVVIAIGPGFDLLLQNTLRTDLTADDFIFGVPVLGTGGADVLLGTAANEWMLGLDGDDTLIGSEGNDVMLGGGGNDFLAFHTFGNNTGTGGEGADTFFMFDLVFTAPHPGSPPVATTITDFEIGIDKVVVGTFVADPLAGAVQVGSDVVIDYGANRSLVLSDTLLGDLSASDFFFGTPLSGSEFADTVIGGAGSNLMHGFGGDDTITGGAADDYLLGGDGNDVLSGVQGNDTIAGGSGNDTIFGGAGNDDLSGDDGDDIIITRGGDDRMTGGAGADTFGIHIPDPDVFLQNTLDGFGIDTITDFEAGVDTIRFGWVPFDLLSLAVQVGNDVVIDYAVGSTLVLENFNLADLSATDFTFDLTPVDDPGLF